MTVKRKHLGDLVIGTAFVAGIGVGVYATRKFGVKPQDTAKVVNDWIQSMWVGGYDVYTLPALHRETIREALGAIPGNIAKATPAAA